MGLAFLLGQRAPRVAERSGPLHSRFLCDASPSRDHIQQYWGDAVELFGATNNGPTALTVNLMIVNHSGPNPGLIKYVYFFSGPAPTINEFATNSGTIFGHANAAGAEAVGAARYSNTPAFGVSPPVLEFFSSSGTTPILFDVAGNRLATPDPRANKPEMWLRMALTRPCPGFRISSAHPLQRPMRRAWLLCFCRPSQPSRQASYIGAWKIPHSIWAQPGSITAVGLDSFRRTRRWPLLRKRPPWILTETGRGPSGVPRWGVVDFTIIHWWRERNKLGRCTTGYPGAGRLRWGWEDG